jgi:uncharacterized phage protein (TIGR02218 family)
MIVRELYHINIDPVQQFYFTSADHPITYLGNTYVPTTITRGDMIQREEMNRQNLTLKIPFDNPMPEIYFREVPDVVAIVTMYRFEEDQTTSEPNVLVYWKGRIAGFKANGQEVTFDCESVFTSMRRTGNRAMYSVQCRHALYGTSCGVDKADYGISATVTSVNEIEIGLTLGTPPSDSDLETDSNGDAVVTGQYFIGGMMEYNGLFRFITNQGEDFVRLWREMPDLEVGNTVTVYPGCNRSLSTCKDKFSNVINYGGFPWLPKSNPFSFVNNF